MKLKDIHKTAGQQVQDWAVENQRLQKNTENLSTDLISGVLSFWWDLSQEGDDFWDDVNEGMTEQQLRLKYHNLHWKPQTPKEIAQNLLKGLSEDVLEEIRKQLETNKTK